MEDDPSVCSMSELTRCNWCDVQEMDRRATARGAHLEIHRVPAWSGDGWLVGSPVLR